MADLAGHGSAKRGRSASYDIGRAAAEEVRGQGLVRGCTEETGEDDPSVARCDSRCTSYGHQLFPRGSPV